MADLGSTQPLALAWSLGWRIAAGLIIGYYADVWLGTSPWLTLSLSLAALIVGVRQMIMLLDSRRDVQAGDDQ